MPFMICPQCDYLIVDPSLPCPSCGATIPAAPPPPSPVQPRPYREQVQYDDDDSQKGFSRKTITVIYLLGVIACLFAAEGLNRFEWLVGAFGRVDVSFYTVMFAVSHFCVVLFILALLTKLSKIMKWVGVVCLLVSTALMLTIPSFPVTIQIIVSIIVALVCIFFNGISKKMTAAILCVVVILFAGGGGFYYYKGGSLTNNPLIEGIRKAIFGIESISSDLTVHFLDVGQGDSILIQLPNGQVMLIDGGGADSASSILSYMRSLKITTIDYLVATHPHEDHIGGLPSIIEAIDIKAIYMPRISHNTQIFERLLAAIQNKGLQVDAARAGVSILSIPDLQIDIVAPVRDDYSELNNHSAVIKLTFRDSSFLFAGDAEALSEGDITANVLSDVLKVGHHGSNTSTSESFLYKVQPIFAVISVGSNNSYGLPADEVLSRLDDLGVYVFRTDIQGTIISTSDGDIISFNTEPTPYQPNAPPSGSGTFAHESSEASEGMVWLSASGSRYHRINNCGRMNPNRARQVTLESARERYEPCENCNPPR